MICKWRRCAQLVFGRIVVVAGPAVGEAAGVGRHPPQRQQHVVGKQPGQQGAADHGHAGKYRHHPGRAANLLLRGPFGIHELLVGVGELIAQRLGLPIELRQVPQDDRFDRGDPLRVVSFKHLVAQPGVFAVDSLDAVEELLFDGREGRFACFDHPIVETLPRLLQILEPLAVAVVDQITTQGGVLVAQRNLQVLHDVQAGHVFDHRFLHQVAHPPRVEDRDHAGRHRQERHGDDDHGELGSQPQTHETPPSFAEKRMNEARAGARALAREPPPRAVIGNSGSIILTLRANPVKVCPTVRTAANRDKLSHPIDGCPSA